MIASLFLQGVVFLSGIILPRFFLQEYGSNINGMVTSVNQFLVYLGLAEAGSGLLPWWRFTRLLPGEIRRKSMECFLLPRRFYNRSGYLFGALTAGLAPIYPYLITQQLSASLVRTMILILASSTLVDYFCLGKYKVLLTADQRGYVVSYVQAAGTLLEHAGDHPPHRSARQCAAGEGGGNAGVYPAVFPCAGLCGGRIIGKWITMCRQGWIS